jgi:hypothetical protein
MQLDGSIFDVGSPPTTRPQAEIKLENQTNNTKVEKPTNTPTTKANLSDVPDIPDDVDHFNPDKVSAMMQLDGLQALDYYISPEPNAPSRSRSRETPAPLAVASPGTYDNLISESPPPIMFPTTLPPPPDVADVRPSARHQNPFWIAYNSLFGFPGGMDIHH